MNLNPRGIALCAGRLRRRRALTLRTAEASRREVPRPESLRHGRDCGSRHAERQQTKLESAQTWLESARNLVGCLQCRFPELNASAHMRRHGQFSKFWVCRIGPPIPGLDSKRIQAGMVRLRESQKGQSSELCLDPVVIWRYFSSN